jgi:hypothetical protein
MKIDLAVLNLPVVDFMTYRDPDLEIRAVIPEHTVSSKKIWLG